jgi:pyruvate dehydrogenase E2 component (dihydrolipoamide acetyltransferase)
VGTTVTTTNQEVLMPLMGEGITEATLVKWLKKPGDKVTKEEPLLEVSTDKVDTEIPSPFTGVLSETLAAEGATVPINAVIALIAGEGSGMAESGKAKPSSPAARHGASSSPAAKGGVGDPSTDARRPSGAGHDGRPQPRPGHDGARPVRAPGETVRSSPLVRKMARDIGLDLQDVAGSGLGGRITKRDLLNHDPAAPSSRSAPTGPTLGRVETKNVNGVETVDGVPVRREKMSKMRQLIAEHMVRSVATSPHVTTVFEIDMSRVVKLREKEKQAFASREGFNLTYTPFFIHAAVEAIKRFPIVNVSVDGTDVLWKDQVNIGCAVAIDGGLIVPVIKNAQELNLAGLARRLNDLAVRARSKKLMPEDVQGGTFSITNPGMFGSIVSAPIINQPQVAIMSIGTIVKRPVVVTTDGGDTFGIKPLVQIGLTFDHRVVDGEGGARFLAALKEVLENYPETPL